MPTVRKPRSGSLQYWPRKRARRPYSRIRHQNTGKEARLAGFAGYKVGMTHVLLTDNRKHSMTKGTDISVPVTIIECPPLHVISIRIYERGLSGLRLITEVMGKGPKHLSRKLRISRKDSTKQLSEAEKLLEKATAVRVNVSTQPELTGIGKKKPEVFEVAIGGDVKEQFSYASSILGKTVSATDVLAGGQQLTVHGVSKGKGYQGPVKRFGIGLKSHKSEKGIRAPGNLGPWTGNRSWTVAHAGQTGYHVRTELNKILLKITDKPEEVNQTGGFKRYGVVKSTCMIVRGSLQGAAKRLLRFEITRRPAKRFTEEAPIITYVSTTSHQGK